ncbi:hypothetical protein P0D88_25295 [Paraburkholderia sp. RL18-103-BIB-C]|uniref:hypothetical protein n=1 Tax=Paraburkholderia sp. RL18-103-BIB-C TaxID=3031637 RepID=UPI0038BC2FD7
MEIAEVAYMGLVLTPLAAYDEGMYAAMLIVRKPDGTERATEVLGRFPCAAEARRVAIAFGVSQIDARRLPGSEWRRQDAGNRAPR